MCFVKSNLILFVKQEKTNSKKKKKKKKTFENRNWSKIGTATPNNDALAGYEVIPPGGYIPTEVGQLPKLQQL